MEQEKTPVDNKENEYPDRDEYLPKSHESSTFGLDTADFEGIVLCMAYVLQNEVQQINQMKAV